MNKKIFNLSLSETSDTAFDFVNMKGVSRFIKSYAERTEN